LKFEIDNDKIDFTTYLNCIALASQHLKYDINPNPIQKLIFLLNKLGQSEGYTNANKQLSSLK